jgi:hydroxymethylpyrimidine pyrophosphatase-like HAD family hydrolase
VKLGIAVENAKDILKKVAQAVTLSNDDDGVAEVLEILLKM